MGAFNLGDGIYGAATGGDFIFYPGWTAMHADWEPFSISYAELMPDGRFALIEQYMAVSTSIILGYALIALFGFAGHAREIYANFFWTILNFFGKKRPERHRSMMDMESLQFKTKTNMMEYDLHRCHLLQDPVSNRRALRSSCGSVVAAQNTMLEVQVKDEGDESVVTLSAVVSELVRTLYPIRPRNIELTLITQRK